jgi:hypothetical protein
MLTTPALASETAGNTPDQPSQKPAKEKKICKTEEASSVSRMRKRTCRTAKEWEDARSGGASTADLQRMGAR